MKAFLRVFTAFAIFLAAACGDKSSPTAPTTTTQPQAPSPAPTNAGPGGSAGSTADCIPSLIKVTRKDNADGTITFIVANGSSAPCDVTGSMLHMNDPLPKLDTQEFVLAKSATIAAGATDGSTFTYSLFAKNGCDTSSQFDFHNAKLTDIGPNGEKITPKSYDSSMKAKEIYWTTAGKNSCTTPPPPPAAKATVSVTSACVAAVGSFTTNFSVSFTNVSSVVIDGPGSNDWTFTAPGTKNLPGVAGDYKWTATANSGVPFDGSSSGTLKVADCSTQPPAVTTVTWHHFAVCDVEPNEVEIRGLNNGPDDVFITGVIWAKPDGGVAKKISEVPAQYQLVTKGNYGGPDERISNQYPYFKGVVYGSAEARTKDGKLISTEVMPETPLTCGKPPLMVEWSAFAVCHVEPNEVEIRAHNLISNGISIVVTGTIWAKPDGGVQKILSEVPPQYQVVPPDGWGGPDERIENQYSSFTGVVWGTAVAKTQQGVVIDTKDLPMTRLTCPGPKPPICENKDTHKCNADKDGKNCTSEECKKDHCHESGGK